MEDVLAVYTRPYDPKRPQVCMDEVSKQLLRDVREPLPVRPGQPARVDYEYERGGVVNLFLFCEPLQGRRWVDVTEHRTKADWAYQIQELVDVRYPEADCIVLADAYPLLRRTGFGVIPLGPHRSRTNAPSQSSCLVGGLIPGRRRAGSRAAGGRP
jgi:hypothetical protein